LTNQTIARGEKTSAVKIEVTDVERITEHEDSLISTAVSSNLSLRPTYKVQEEVLRWHSENEEQIADDKSRRSSGKRKHKDKHREKSSHKKHKHSLKDSSRLALSFDHHYQWYNLFFVLSQVRYSPQLIYTLVTAL